MIRAAALLFALAVAQAQSRLDAERQIASTTSTIAGRILVWLPAGPVRVANLDEAHFEITTPTPAGVATLRLKAPPQAAPREKAVKLVFAGGPVTLPDTPIAGTVVKVFLNGASLDPTAGGDYTISGRTITPSAALPWIASDVIVAVYFH